MESDRGFNFKLLIPSKMNNGQVSAVRLQDNDENYGNFMNTFVTLPGKSMLHDVNKKMEHSQQLIILFSKLFDEVEKIKCWKVQLDSDAVQNERRLQENKRTIETQRKVIQELQFGNESLSIKLEEQISDNESLRNKNNATKNLCNILKDTFERSAEKMHIFESEREETYHLFMENSESIQKLIAAFESLRFRAEADQQEMLKVKASLLQFEELKEKYHQDYIMKKEEVVVLQTKLRDKENELQKILLNFHESQKHCKQLEEGTNEQYDLLRSLKTEKESLLQELHIAKQCCEETEVSVLTLEFSAKLKTCVVPALIKMIKLKIKHRKKRAVFFFILFYFILFILSFNISIVYFQNKVLKKQIAKEISKSSHLEIVIKSLHEECENLKRLNKEDHLLKDLEYKSKLAAELNNEVQKLRSTVAEATKTKEETELKCQHKIADMVALMGKHKSQYDRIIEEKDAQLDEEKRKEMEAAAHSQSMSDLFLRYTFLLFTLLSKVTNKGVQNIYRLPHTSYRVRTPPSALATCWKNSTFELDPMSDSSDQSDIFVSVFCGTQKVSAPRCQTNFLKKIQSPVNQKSPGNTLKFAAMKRMRDAGWTAVTSCDKKKKKISDNIFA
uniref:Uncharacterized protein n=1 Tax=Mola mola TaxID=94237 RepID=A0A3Q3W1S5_MOLML